MVSVEDMDLDLTGSTGFPYRYTGCVSKKDWYKRYSSHYERWKLELGKQPGYCEVWDCFPKIEILSKERALIKSRLISGTSCEMAFLGGQLFSEQNTAINKRPIHTRSSVGKSPHGGGWNDIAKFIGPFAESSDVSGFDQSISPGLLLSVYRVREYLMKFPKSSEGDLQRSLFWRYFNEVVRSTMHTSHGKVYNVFGGNKSGQFNTCHDNTIAHIIVVFYALIRCGYKYADCISHRFLVFGDDLISAPFPDGFWDYYKECGFRIKQIKVGPIETQEYLSHLFTMTPWGYMPVHKNDKALYSAYTSESKKWKQHRVQKLYSLWLGNFWKPSVRSVLERCLDYHDIPFSDLEAIQYWTYLL